LDLSVTVEQPFGFLKSGFTHRALIARLAEERKLQLLCEQLRQPRLLDRSVLGANAFDSKVFLRAT
jgi:hypothetical protein